MRSKCHQPSPRNSKRRKIDSRSSCPSHLACEWTVSGGQNEARAGRTWMDFGFFSGMTRFQKLKVITDLPLRLVALAPFFQVARQAGCCHAWQHVMGSNLGNSVAECRKFSIQLYPTLDLVGECPMLFSQTCAMCHLFVLLTSKAVPFIPQDIFLVNNHVLKTSSNWGRAHHCLLGSSPAPQAIRRDAGVVAAGWVSAERRILSSGGILILDESLGQSCKLLKGECS